MTSFTPSSTEAKKQPSRTRYVPQAAGLPDVGIAYAGVSLAFGLTVLTMAFAIGHISGCHLNPAVSLGLAVAGRFEYKELPAYVIAQVLGGIVAASDRRYQLKAAARESADSLQGAPAR